MNIIIFHYHLDLGGISSVIQQSLLSISSTLNNINSVTILTGRATQDFVQALEKQIQIPIVVDVHPELGYLSDLPKKQRNKPKQIKQKIQEILKHYADQQNIWWIHNYHLGKNPIFTETLLKTLSTLHMQPSILHIHDFPENGRFSLFRNLTKNIDTPLYPLGPRIRYAVISTHDRKILLKAGLPEEMVFYVPNPVLKSSTLSISDKEKRQLREKLAAMNSHSHTYDPKKLHALYPVRTIRRKNILEAAMFLKCFQEDINLIVTLPGVSDLENSYSDLISYAFSEHLIHGLWGLGQELDKPDAISFNQLFALSDIVISSSIQEGFGYQYINALFWRKPLFARFVPPMEDMADLINTYPHIIYNSFKVPVSSPTLGNIREQIHEQYTIQLEMIRGMSKIAPQEHNMLQESYEQLMRTEDVDFCHLAPSVQHCYLTDASDPGFRATILELNSKLYQNFSTLLDAECPDMEEQINTSFGVQSFTASFTKILNTLDFPIYTEVDAKNIEKKVFEAFSTPMLFSPLYLPYTSEGN